MSLPNRNINVNARVSAVIRNLKDRELLKHAPVAQQRAPQFRLQSVVQKQVMVRGQAPLEGPFRGIWERSSYSSGNRVEVRGTHSLPVAGPSSWGKEKSLNETRKSCLGERGYFANPPHHQISISKESCPQVKKAVKAVNIRIVLSTDPISFKSCGFGIRCFGDCVELLGHPAFDGFNILERHKRDKKAFWSNLWSASPMHLWKDKKNGKMAFWSDLKYCEP